MLIERDPPVDWKAVILELRTFGFTLHAIAKSINVAPSTVQHWLDYGKEPMFEHGRALLKLLTIQREKCNSNASSG